MTSLISLVLFIICSCASTSFAANTTAGNELSQTYENETANVRIHYPVNWFAETKNLVTPSIVRIFPMDFMSERIPTVELVISVLNGTQSGVSFNLTEMADSLEASVLMNPDSRVINSTMNATLFTGTVPAWEGNYYDFSRLAFVTDAYRYYAAT